MMASPPPQDILMLSELSWKLTCAFAAARGNAPSEFWEVEDELKSLTSSITKLARVIEEDGETILQPARQSAKEGIVSILDSCLRTLEDLNTFVHSYQDVKRMGRSWRKFFLENYKDILWTTNGGNIQSLRVMLAIHNRSMILSRKAFRTHSLPQFESIIEIIAGKVAQIHGRQSGDLDIKLDGIRAALASINDTRDSSFTDTSSNASSRDGFATSRKPSLPTHIGADQPPIPPRSHRRIASSTNSPEPQSPLKTPELSDSELTQSPTGQNLSAHPDRTSSRNLPRQFYQLPEGHTVRELSPRKNESLPHRLEKLDIGPRRLPGSGDSLRLSPGPSLSPRSPLGSVEDNNPFDHSSAILPPPYIPFNSMGLDSPDASGKVNMSDVNEGDDKSVASKLSQKAKAIAAWEKVLFTNSAILCDIRGKVVEYATPDENRPGDNLMVRVCGDCRICLITKPQRSPTGNVRYFTSIWAISDDGEVRLEQKIPDDTEVVPYTIWDNYTKIVLRLKTELQYHNVVPEAPVVKRADTTWVNYIFPNEHSATLFQNALMGKTLMLSTRTRRVMRHFQGVSGAFAFAEQLCGLENFRIFYDGRSNIAYGMIHYASDFSDGYLTIPLNDTRNPVQIRDESEVIVRIKGLKIPIKEKGPRRPSTSSGGAKTKSDKFITGVKVQFYEKNDKSLFMAKLKEIQDSFIGNI